MVCVHHQPGSANSTLPKIGKKIPRSAPHDALWRTVLHALVLVTVLFGFLCMPGNLNQVMAGSHVSIGMSGSSLDHVTDHRHHHDNDSGENDQGQRPHHDHGISNHSHDTAGLLVLKTAVPATSQSSWHQSRHANIELSPIFRIERPPRPAFVL